MYTPQSSSPIHHYFVPKSKSNKLCYLIAIARRSLKETIVTIHIDIVSFNRVMCGWGFAWLSPPLYVKVPRLILKAHKHRLTQALSSCSLGERCPLPHRPRQSLRFCAGCPVGVAVGVLVPKTLRGIRAGGTCIYVCIVITYSKSVDQPGKVASPARGQLNRKTEYFPVRVRA